MVHANILHFKDITIMQDTTRTYTRRIEREITQVLVTKRFLTILHRAFVSIFTKLLKEFFLQEPRTHLDMKQHVQGQKEIN